MDCVNHKGVAATAYCQNCGKGLCTDCIAAGVLRHGSSGQILCDACINAWQSVQQPFTAVPRGPNPAAAAVLGLIPGVGAMYNGQVIKGLIHVVIFAVLISITEHHGIFGIFIGAWVLYQAFEAYHTAKALRDGQPAPDPFGLNELGNWLHVGKQPPYPPPPGVGQDAYTPGPAASGSVPPTGNPYQPPFQGPYEGSYEAPYSAPYRPWTPDFPDPLVPPIHWRRKEPVGAIVLIGLGLLFLLGQLDLFQGRFFEYVWPLGLIALGAWLVVRRIEESHGGPK